MKLKLKFMIAFKESQSTRRQAPGGARDDKSAIAAKWIWNTQVFHQFQ